MYFISKKQTDRCVFWGYFLMECFLRSTFFVFLFINKIIFELGMIKHIILKLIMFIWTFQLVSSSFNMTEHLPFKNLFSSVYHFFRFHFCLSALYVLILLYYYRVSIVFMSWIIVQKNNKVRFINVPSVKKWIIRFPTLA